MRAKRLSCLLLCTMLLLILPLADTVIAADVWDGSMKLPDGSGSPTTPYQIGTAQELAWFAAQVNNGQADICAVLGADIILNNTSNWKNWASSPPENEWIPIGIDITHWFTGSFDGNGHTISGVYINSTDNRQGLFGYIAAGAAIENLGLVQSYIKGGNYTGGICGYSLNGIIKDSYNTGTVNGLSSTVGGICGCSINNTIIENCRNAGEISGSGTVGGIVGSNSSRIAGCCNTDIINSTGTGWHFGGVCGTNRGNVIDSYNTGTISASSNNNVGGVCGYNNADITNTYNSGTVTGSSNVGKVCGYSDTSGTLNNCLFIGTQQDEGVGINLSNSAAKVNSADEFASGETAYSLGSAFGQKLGNDTLPVFRASDGSNTVFRLLYMNSTDVHAVQYYNYNSTVSDALVAIPESEIGNFSEWVHLPDTMPAEDVTATALFLPPPTAVRLISAAADGGSGITTSTKITLGFDTEITGLTANNITITDITGSADKGTVTGSGKIWSIELTSVACEGAVSVAVSGPQGYTISGFPQNVSVYKKAMPALSITTVTLPAATAGKAYLQVINTEYTGSSRLIFSAAGFPAGISVNTETGTISGTPDAGADADSPYCIDVKVTDGMLTDSAVYSYTVNSNDDNNAPHHPYRTLIDNATGITISGFIPNSAVMTISEIDLHDEGSCPACDTIRRHMNNGNLILLLAKDISVSRGYTGKLTVTMPVNTQFNGKTATILHCRNSTLETFTAPVTNGKAVFTVTGLSPVAMFIDAEQIELPNTGSSNYNLIWGKLGVNLFHR